MLRFVYTVAIIWFATASLLAQKCQIIITDGDLGTRVPDVYLVLLDPASGDTINMKITDVNGQVRVNLTQPVLLHMSHLNYVPRTDTLFPGDELRTFKMVPLSFQLVPTVITGQYKPENPKNSLHSVRVITMKTIQQRAANNIRELLSQELNIRVSQDNILGSGLTLQGLGGEQVKYMVDGVPIIGRVNGDIDISQINLNDVERIEIIEGPASVLYGTNALGGVINIITKTEQSEKLHTGLNLYYESVGNYNTDLMVSFSNKRHFVSLNAGHYYFDGFTLDETSRDELWNPKRQLFGGIKYGFTFNSGLRMLISSQVFNEKITNKGDVRYGNGVYAFDDYYTTFRTTNSATFSGRVFKRHYLNQVLSYSYYKRQKNTYRTDLTTFEEIPVADPDQHDTTTFQSYMARGFLSLAEDTRKLNYQVGYEANVEIGTGKKIESGSQVIGDYALFLSLKYAPVKQFVVQPGMRWSYNTAYHAPVTPSIHFKITPMSRLTIRMSYARGFRAPTIKELYFDFYDINHNIYGNKDLEAEYSNNLTVSLSYQQTFDKEQLLKISPNFFFNDVKNDIALIPDYSNTSTNTNQPYTYANFSSNRILGSGIRFTYLMSNRFTVKAGFSYIGQKYIFNDSVSSSHFVFSPEVSAEVSYLIPKAQIRISVFNKYNGKLKTPYLDTDGSFKQTTVNPYNLVDITLGRSFWKDRIAVSAGVKNVSNVVNVNTSGGVAGVHTSATNDLSIGWGRSYFVALKWNMNIE